jgi:hypothetical protein
MAVTVLQRAVAMRGLRLQDLHLTLAASRMGSDEIRAIRSVCRIVKRLSLFGGRDTADIAGLLRKENGLSVVEQPSAAQLTESDAYLLFNKPVGIPEIVLRPGSIAVEVGSGWNLQTNKNALHIDGAKFALPHRYDVPPGYDAQELIAALLRNGGISSKNLSVTALTSGGVEVS